MNRVGHGGLVLNPAEVGRARRQATSSRQPTRVAGRSRRFARHWNGAQAIAGVQLAVGANSPFFYGKELWRETRIALFEQATDTRPEELKAQGVRPRVWFGERWITSIFDLFEENVRYFPALLPVCQDEDPVTTLASRARAAARRTAPSQRHDLPLEPPDLRRGFATSPTSGREPARLYRELMHCNEPVDDWPVA